MKNKFLLRKPKLSKNKSASKTVAEARAQLGEGIPFIFARASSIPAVVSDALETGKYCFLKDLQAALEKIAEVLQSFEPDSGNAFVMVDRKEALKLALTLVLTDLNTSHLLSLEFEPTAAIQDSREELFSTVEKVKEILQNCDEPEFTIEKFREEMQSFDNPSMAKRVLKALSTNAPTLLKEDGIEVPLTLEKKSPKDLPSDKPHTLRVTVTSGFNEESRTTTVVINHVVSADTSLFQAGNFMKILCVDDEMRLSLLLAQAAKTALQVVVSVPRVPLVASVHSTLSTTLEEVAILDFDGSDILKTLMAKQQKLDL